MNRTTRAVIVYGNDAILHINMKRYDKQTGTFIDFDMTNTTDVTVELTCSKHATHIPLEFTINSGNNSILDCPIDYRLLHANTSYGVIVQGYDENEVHFRFEMLPSELMLVINNTSGLKITDDVSEQSIESITVTGAVGWGIATTVHADWEETDPEKAAYIENKPDIDGMIDSALENYYDKTETDTLLDNKADTADLGDYYTKTETDALLDTKADAADLGDYYTKTETDTLLDTKADASDLASKQDVLVSGTNIKTINNQSLLGSGNIDIQGGGSYTAGDNIDITNNTISLEDDIYLNTVNASNINIYNRIDYVKWYDGDHRYLAQQAMEGNQYRIGSNWPNHPGYTLYVNTQDGLVTISGEWVYADQNIPSYVQPQDDVYVTVSTVINGEPVYGVYNHDSDSPDFFIYDDNYTITEVYAEYKYMNQADWHESNPESPAYIHNKPDIPNYTGGNSIAIDQTTQEISLQEVVNAKYISVKKIYNGGEIYQIDYQRWADTPCRYLAHGALDNTQYRIGNQWYGWDRYYNLIIETESHGTSAFNGTWVTAGYLPAWLGGGDPSGWFYTSNFTVNGEPVYGVYNPDSDSPDFYIYDADNYDITHMYVVYTYPSQLLHANWNEIDYNSPSYIENKPNLSNYATQSDLANKQDLLVSGTNIKTINNISILGSGDITISGGGVQSNWNETDSSSLAYIQNKPDLSIYAQSSNLATVATSGDYNDLSNKPTINTPGFNQLVNGNKTGLVSSLATNYSTNIGQAATIEGDSDGINGYKPNTASGDYSHTEGSRTTASSKAAHAEGYQTTASGNYSHAEGISTTANKQGAHAEGSSTTASGDNSHTEGSSTTASGNSSHAEGSGSEAQANYSHAEGYNTIAKGQFSHTEGNQTETNNQYEHAEGKFNISSKANNNEGDSGNTLSSIGNGIFLSGTGLFKHNAFEVRQNGDIYYSDTEKIDGSTVHYYDTPMRKLQDVMVTSSSVNGMKIEVVSSLPSVVDQNTVYLVV